MSKENIYTGAAAELFVAKRLLENFWPVFYKMVDCDADLIALQPKCNHAVTIQVKLAYANQSFHAGEYKNIDYYAVVYQAFIEEPSICWIPCHEVKANSHASLTQEWKDWYTNSIPEALCTKCQESS